LNKKCYQAVVNLIVFYLGCCFTRQ